MFRCHYKILSKITCKNNAPPYYARKRDPNIVHAHTFLQSFSNFKLFHHRESKQHNPTKIWDGASL